MELVFETLAEIALRTHTDHIAYFADGVSAREQELLGIVHLVLSDVFDGGDAREGLHLAIERVLADIDGFGNVADIGFVA